jgi:carotenoid 1,2-hydratase
VRPYFDTAVPPGGYRWWYVDALSDDGSYGLTIIGFVGSVFSPYYKNSGRKIPLDHSCLNIALYGKSGARWVMTERCERDTAQSQDCLQIGPSAMRWHDDKLIIEIEERDIRLGIPWRRRVAGKIVLTPQVLNARGFDLERQTCLAHDCAARRYRSQHVTAGRFLVWQCLSRWQSRQRTD